jgi:hypothetical protein
MSGWADQEWAQGTIGKQITSIAEIQSLLSADSTTLIGEFAVSVEWGEVVEATALDAGAIVMMESSGPGLVPTIGELVAELEAAILDGAERVYLELDSDESYPSLIEIDYLVNATDDEVCYEISDFVAR